MFCAADQQIFTDRRGNRYGAEACYEPLEYKKDLESEQTFCGAFANLRRPSPTFAESKIRISVLTEMRGRVGGDMAVLEAHLCRQLILSATAAGAATTVAPRAGPVFGEGSAKVGEGRRRSAKVGTKTSQTSVSEPPGGHCMVPGDSHTRLPALYALPVEKIVFDGQ